MKVKKDLSMIALIFFITRCFYNLYTFTNLISFLIISAITLVLLIIIKKIKGNLQNIKLFQFLYVLSLIAIFITILINTTKFININYFKYYNYFVVTLSLLIISYIIGKDEIKTIASISEVFLMIFVIISVLISVGLISLIKIGNYHDFIDINSISINLLPVSIIIVLFYLKENNIMTGYILGNLSALFDTILIIGCLGSKLTKTYSYPAIAILNSITFFNFINHLDQLFSFIYLFEYTITLALIINILKDILKKRTNLFSKLP